MKLKYDKHGILNPYRYLGKNEIIAENDEIKRVDGNWLIVTNGSLNIGSPKNKLTVRRRMSCK